MPAAATQHPARAAANAAAASRIVRVSQLHPPEEQQRKQRGGRRAPGQCRCKAGHARQRITDVAKQETSPERQNFRRQAAHILITEIRHIAVAGVNQLRADRKIVKCPGQHHGKRRRRHRAQNPPRIGGERRKPVPERQQQKETGGRSVGCREKRPLPVEQRRPEQCGGDSGDLPLPAAEPPPEQRERQEHRNGESQCAAVFRRAEKTVAGNARRQYKGE